MDSIDAVAGTTGGKGFAAIKITALGKPKLLLNISEVLVKSKQYYQKSSKSALDQVQVKIHMGPFYRQDPNKRRGGTQSFSSPPYSLHGSRYFLTSSNG